MKLYLIGVGPGDPELICIKAKKLLEEIKLIFYPTGGKETIALSIIEKIVDLSSKKLVELYFPMKKDFSSQQYYRKLSQIILRELSFEKKGIFITLGDPAFYSTFFYLTDFLLPSVELEIIPGISSFSGVSALLKIPFTLGSETAVILSAKKFLKNSEILDNFDTLIIMKPHKYLKEIASILKNKNYKYYYVKRAFLNGQKIIDNLEKVSEEDLDYFSLVIIRKK